MSENSLKIQYFVLGCRIHFIPETGIKKQNNFTCTLHLGKKNSCLIHEIN